MDVGRVAAAAANAYQAQAGNTKNTKETKESAQVKEVKKVLKNSGVTNSEAYGKTIGEPQLSEKAAKYYDSLKSKFGDMDFVLVANDSIEGAEQKTASIANGGKTIVLIDAEKIERMAEDEDYRNKYEGIIKTAQKELPELAKQMSGLKSIDSFGMRVGDDGKVSFFAVSKKNNDAVNEKMAQKRAEKKEQAKKDAKKAEKKKAEEKLKETRETKKAKESEQAKKAKEAEEEEFDPDDYEVLEADSIEELLKLVQDREFNFRSDNVMTEQEAMIGSMFDLSL